MSLITNDKEKPKVDNIHQKKAQHFNVKETAYYFKI